MNLPSGCGLVSGKVVRLNKSLYGRRQASRLVSELKRITFEQFISDPSLCPAFRGGRRGV